MNQFNAYKRMELPHICERLRNLSEHRTPGAMTGQATPTKPIPLHEWLLLQEAAVRIERLEVDNATYRRTTQETPHNWPYWAIVDSKGFVIEISVKGKMVAQSVLNVFINEDRPGAKGMTIRPMIIGGVRHYENSEDEKIGMWSRHCRKETSDEQ